MTGSPPAAAQDDGASIWAELALGDLEAIRDLLAENHPGPVDLENSRYGEWLRDGFAEASQRAGRADSMADYERTLRFFVNGFRDGHIALGLNYQPRIYSWPRFLVRRSVDGNADSVFYSNTDAVPVGAKLQSCDGQAVDALLGERVDPYFFNADIPHTRRWYVPRLFTLDPGDEELQLAQCTFLIDGETRAVDLEWARLSARTRSEQFASLRSDRPELGIAERDGIVFVGLPSFVQTGSRARTMQAVIDEIGERRDELRSRAVVFDVRGNGGGNSAWGVAVAQALYGEEWVSRITESFDATVDWRVSAANMAHLDGIFETVSRDGLADAAEYVDGVRTAMAAALERDEALVRTSDPGTEPSGPPPANPISGRVYFLTDSRCGSACLDFADVMRRLPGVTHIGLPTYADAIYIDNTVALLPSGLARFSYSLKVYRNRVRGNNEFYTPEIPWPGGPMTDEAVTAWIGELAGHTRSE
ncbi:S41 family peptidase [Parasphingopyxis sp.]|uniref:S41 family peptidase n=1 Tax=Parasphingopyxis sp. TaxID=1920299 RepID=UPI002602DB92|nr:S41 family peptidase [Parasphingopyxis sp.]